MRFTPTAAVLALTATPAAAQYVLADYTAGFPELIGVDDAEFTPDGRWLVVRDNTALTTALVYDARTGAEIFRYMPVSGGFGGVCEDAVVTTNDRAVVIGSQVMFLDLNDLAGSPYAEHYAGFRPRDLALTPDETILAVRGDDGQYLYDLASGIEFASGPGEPPPWSPIAFEVDSVAVTDEHAVFTSYLIGSQRTRVTVWDLHPIGGGPPAVVFETAGAGDQQGGPHDVVITPDGSHAAVRSETQVGLYRLNGAASTQVWLQGLHGGLADPFGGSAMDSLVASDTMVASISRRVSVGVGAQIDVWTVPAGANKWSLLDGDPHDLELTPNRRRLVVRTHLKLYLFDVGSLPAFDLLAPLDEVALAGNMTSWASGLDSVFVTGDRVLAISRKDNDSKVRVFDIRGDSFVKLLGTSLGEPGTDVAITPDGTRGLISGRTRVMVVDLRLNKVVLDHDPLGGGSYPWCDGVAVTNEQAAGFGYRQNNAVGWLSILDLFSRADNYCTANANSTGLPGAIVATGSSRVGDNDLVLTAIQLPVGEFGQFVYGDQTQQLPYGDGFVCVAGQVARFPVQAIGPAGRATQAIDNGNLPPGGGALAAGTTWNFQLVHRDAGSFNLTDAVSVLFE